MEKNSKETTSLVVINDSENSCQSTNQSIIDNKEYILSVLNDECMSYCILKEKYPDIFDLLTNHFRFKDIVVNEDTEDFVFELLKWGLNNNIKLSSYDTKRWLLLLLYYKQQTKQQTFDVSESFVLFSLDNIKLETIKKYMPLVCDYLMTRFPIPEDMPKDVMNTFISSTYSYMIRNKIETYPKSLISDNYVKFRSYENRFNLFVDKNEMYSEEGKQIIKENLKQSVMKKYGVENAMQVKEIQEKAKQTNLERYGVEHALQNKEIQEKAKQTNLDRYGVEYAIQSEEIQKKAKQTNLDRYGVEHTMQSEEVKEKAKQTNLERYGVEYAMQSEEIQEKARQTYLNRYGVENPGQSEEIKEKIKQTNLNKYGVENPIQSEEIQEKAKQTYLDRYGVEKPAQSEEVKEKMKQTNLERYGVEHALQNNEFQEKTKQTNLNRYGVENVMYLPEFVKKAHETKKKLGSYGKSVEEDKIYEMLVSKFGEEDVIRQHRDELRYNFNCDFYIKSRDLFIEYNGYWQHNDHLFNQESEEDLLILEEWKQKAINSDGYSSAVNVWTRRDCLKYQTAQENKLNYKILWNLKEAEDFINSL